MGEKKVNLRLFLRGGPNCARLITSRNRDTLPVGAQSVDVDAMRQDEAVALLGAGMPNAAAHESGLRDLAARLGEWPLLLKLANGALRARLERRESLTQALGWAARALDKRGLDAFDARDAAARDQAVNLTIDVSLDLLTAEERARYYELTVFPEDVDVPLAALETLWAATGGLDDFDTEELVQMLADRSLVQHLDLSTRTLRLHDIVRNYLEEQLPDLPALHARLVEVYGARCERDGEGRVLWHTGPHDDYFFAHLAARQAPRLRRLPTNRRLWQLRSCGDGTQKFRTFLNSGGAAALGAHLEQRPSTVA